MDRFWLELFGTRGNSWHKKEETIPKWVVYYCYTHVSDFGRKELKQILNLVFAIWFQVMCECMLLRSMCDASTEFRGQNLGVTNQVGNYSNLPLWELNK